MRFISPRLRRFGQHPNIITPWADAVFIWGAPLLGLLLALGIYWHWIPNRTVTMGLSRSRFWEILILLFFTQSHLFIVLFRAYFNRSIFMAYKKRMMWGPLVLLAGTLVSDWFLMLLLMLNVWWDAYHSALQTFGFARLYDARLGNTSEVGRRLDYVFNLVIYMGPMLGGVTLLPMVYKFHEVNFLRVMFFESIPITVYHWSSAIFWGVLTFSVVFSIYYLWQYWRYVQAGYTVNIHKIILLISTAFTSILAWGLNSFGMAFLIANFFHAWQYFAIVVHTEHGNVAKRLGFAKWPGSKWIAAVVILGSGFLFSYWISTQIALGGQTQSRIAVAILATVAALHFWYDGFVWSVRKGDFT